MVRYGTTNNGKQMETKAKYGRYLTDTLGYSDYEWPDVIREGDRFIIPAEHLQTMEAIADCMDAAMEGEARRLWASMMEDALDCTVEYLYWRKKRYLEQDKKKKGEHKS